MTKKQLTQNQKRRMASKHQERLEARSDPELSDLNFSAPQEGLVVTRFGKVADVESVDGTLYRCDIRRTMTSLVTGDRVIWRAPHDPQGKGIIEACHPRSSALMRPDFYLGMKAIAANIDQIVIVSAVKPELSYNIIDRYLIACEQTGIEPVIVLNKIELLSPEARRSVDHHFDYYRQIGYRTCLISCEADQNIAEFEAILKDKVSILVGQSGVGKSSLIQRVMPEKESIIPVGPISSGSGLGQHTTTASRLYHLIGGGDLIDSPGIREFGLWHLTPDQVLRGFIDFHPYLSDCKFRDCDHRHAAHCGLHHAVQEGKLAPWRLNNYLTILDSIAEVAAKTNRRFT